MVIADDIKDYFVKNASNKNELDKIVKIYNPIDELDIIHKSELPNEPIKWKKNGVQFLCVGTVFPQKAFDRLLHVHKKLIDEGYHHNIHIVGDGYDFKNINALRLQLNLEDTVVMSGFSDNPYPKLKHTDFFLLPSRFEGYPTILFEALILNKKIISTNVSGANEILENGNLGYIAENSEEGIYTALKKAITEPESFDKFLTNLETYKKPFNVKNAVSKIMSVIDE